MKDSGRNLSSIVFWLLKVGIAVIPMFYLAIWGYHEQSLRSVIISMIFLLFILFTFIFDLYKNLYPSGSTFTSNSFSYSLGAIGGYLFGWLGSQEGSVFASFALPEQSLLAQISGEIPIFWNYVVNIVGASTAEEMLFLISIPAIGFMAMDLLGRRIDLFKNPWLQTGMITLIVTPLFYWFHVGKVALSGFFIAVVIFRVLTISFTWGEKNLNLVPFVSLLPAFAFGFHEFNNIASKGGIINYFNILFYQSPHYFGVAIIGIYLIFFLAGIEYIIRKYSPIQEI